MRGHRTSLTVTCQGMCEEGRGEGRVGLKRCCRISKQRAGKPLKGDISAGTGNSNHSLC